MKQTFGAIVFLLFCACTGGSGHRVIFHLTGALQRQFVIERVGLNDEKPVTLDSGVGRRPRDSFVYHLPPMEPTIYQIRFRGKSFQLPFIYDSSDIDVYYNYTTGEYHFTNSPVSEEWRQFQLEQMRIARQEKQLSGRSDSGRLLQDSLLRESYRRNFNFADTVRNPALFLLAYNLVDFGADYKGLGQFMQKAGRRFPAHAGVQALVKNTLEYVRIFGSPLKVGDTLPSLVLPDSDGRNVAIASVRGKYTLIDFWSSWCDECRTFSGAKKEAWRKADTGRFAIISVAIDAEKEAWKSVIRFERYPWPQVIDEKMWSGEAARAFHFDSLPYNFLIGPDGRIVAKGIVADSLVGVIRTVIAQH
jgi:peroxiredoxin